MTVSELKTLLNKLPNEYNDKTIQMIVAHKFVDVKAVDIRKQWDVVYLQDYSLEEDK